MKQNFLKVALFSIFLLGISCKTTSDTNNENRPERMERREGQGERPQNRDGQRGERPSASKLIAEMDVNSDGKLSKSEVKGPLLNDFSKVDVNQDGFITLEELQNAPKPEGGQRR